MDGPFLPDSYTLLEDARAIARFLLFDDVEQRFVLARQARIAYVLSQPGLFLKGCAADAYIAMSPVQGSHRGLWQFLAARFATLDTLFPLDFLIYFDAAAWTRRGWSEEVGRSGFPIQREALVYHELSHLRQLSTSEGEPRFHDDGREMLALRPHTYEFFDTEIHRYGPLTLGLEQVGPDYVQGAKEEKARTRRGKLRLA